MLKPNLLLPLLPTLSWKSSALVFSLALIPTAQALADGALSVQVQNDLFSAGGDGHYTSGVDLHWSFKPQENHWTRSFIDSLPGWNASDLTHVSYFGGQELFTPEEIGEETPDPNDRPYAGLLYGGVGFLQDQQSTDYRKISALHFLTGLVGPGAGGKVTQKAVHKITGSQKPEGWSHQLHNEPFINVNYAAYHLLKTKLSSLEVQYGPNYGFTLGNLGSGLAGGLGASIGRGLDNQLEIISLSSTNSSGYYFEPGPVMNWQIFANIEGRYVANNMLLDGNTFENSASVDKKDFVAIGKLGAVFSWEEWLLSYTTYWKSKEFDTQDSADTFSSITIAKRF